MSLSEFPLTQTMSRTRGMDASAHDAIFGDAPSVAPARMLRVMLVVESSGGGTGRHVLDLAEGLVRLGCDVHLVYSAERCDALFAARLSKAPQLRRHVISMRTKVNGGDLSVIRQVRQYLKENGPFDIVHGHSSKGGAIARLAAWGTGASSFYTIHGLIMMDPCMAGWKWLFYLAVELIMSRWTSRIIAVSPEESREARRLGFGKSRVITIPNGVGEMDLTPRDEARRTLGVSDDVQVIGFVGRLVVQKAPHVLVSAFRQVAAANPRARLAMVGDGPLMAALKASAVEANINDKIIWLGEFDARKVLRGFDIFALSSRKEGLPYVILEAMSAGLPVVATSTSGVEILIEPGGTGAVTPPDDANEMAAALINLLRDPPLLARLGKAGRRRSKLFTIDNMVAQTLDAYRAACPRAPAQRAAQPRLEGQVT